MKPVALLQHERTQRPGLLLQTLERMGIPTRMFFPEQGDEVPHAAHGFSGIALLGSRRSVNDPQPWIADEVMLVRDAMHADIPVLGHSFGAQLMARSLGARVCPAALVNIGWARLLVNPPARPLFQATEVIAFNWQHETFAIPPRAQRLLYNGNCLDKAFSIGRHLAFQCHFEVTQDIIEDWCLEAKTEIAAAIGPAAQTREEILRQAAKNLPALHAIGERIYHHWAASLSRPPVIGLGTASRNRHSFAGL